MSNHPQWHGGRIEETDEVVQQKVVQLQPVQQEAMQLQLVQKEVVQLQLLRTYPYLKRSYNEGYGYFQTAHAEVADRLRLNLKSRGPPVRSSSSPSASPCRGPGG
ncbi:hypothetical protein FOCC_FOCC015199 [Frankliniella occidentalis]|nr:hypothetical protein FOCC_FOCC015199 [Frankliniella occidentalis]